MTTTGWDACETDGVFVCVCFVRSDGGDGGGEYREDVFRSGWAGQGALTFFFFAVVSRLGSSARTFY